MYLSVDYRLLSIVVYIYETGRYVLQTISTMRILIYINSPWTGHTPIPAQFCAIFLWTLTFLLFFFPAQTTPSFPFHSYTFSPTYFLLLPYSTRQLKNKLCPFFRWLDSKGSVKNAFHDCLDEVSSSFRMWPLTPSRQISDLVDMTLRHRPTRPPTWLGRRQR